MTYSLYYDAEENLFFDSDGVVVFDIFRYISPAILTVFKFRRRFIRVPIKDGSIELFYPEEPGYYEWL